jgi:hypothetical protein
MKQYVYYLGNPCVFTAFGGKQFELKNGDIITKNSDGDYEFGSHVFLIFDNDLKSKFMRVYTEQEQMRYERIYEQAMIAAMQSLIEKLPPKISTDMSELENVTSNAIWFAGNLVRKLKDKEF